MICSTAALMAFGTADYASAQAQGYGQGGCPPGQECPQQDMQRSRDNAEQGVTEDQGTMRRRRIQTEDQADESTMRKRRVQTEEQADVDVRESTRMSQTDWRFDPNRHERRRKKDAKFRFFFGGFWYPEPYWRYGLVINPRIGCREGRGIVADNGFRRVRIVECAGRIYTYTGRRGGRLFEISLSSRSGRIVDLDRI
jgi:hypothetical protein